MLPGDGVLRAAHRWLGLLGRSTLPQATAIIRADAAYTDLTPTQYATALDWLQDLNLLSTDTGFLRLAPDVQGMPDADSRRLLFERSLQRAAPAWLPDADALVLDGGELPRDAADLAAVLGLAESAALLAVRQVHGRIDLARRAEVGAAGELGLVMLLERHWPGSTRHVALTDDGLGYDIAFTPGNRTWHLEVKTTSRRGRLVLYLSRHEHEVALLDPDWRLVVVGIAQDHEPLALATVRHEALQGRSPLDRDRTARWESARHELQPADLKPGLVFLNQHPVTDPLLDRGYSPGPGAFMWMPAPGGQAGGGQEEEST